MEATGTPEQLTTAVQALSRARDLATIEGIVPRAARELTGADGATFVLRDGDFCYYAGESCVTPLFEGRRVPITRCVSGWVMLHREPAIVEDVSGDSSLPMDVYRSTFVRSLAVVPIGADAPVGAIGNYWTTPRRPTRDELRLLSGLAAATSAAMENVRLREDMERRLEERTALMEAARRELHEAVRERTLAIEQARRLGEEMEERVRQRTADLERSVEQLRHFAHIAAHDLKEPLRVVAAYMDLLRQRYGAALNAEAHEFIGYAADGAARMSELLDALLRYASLDWQRFERKPVPVLESLQQVLEGLAMAIRESDARITWDDLPVVMADPAHVRQLLQNLIGNAIKFRKGPGPRIHVSAREEPDAWVITVRDDGVGFDPRHAERIFVIFQQLNEREKYPGAGIGLSVCRRIVGMHGGRIWADSAPDQGSAFSFTMPRPPAETRA